MEKLKRGKKPRDEKGFVWKETDLHAVLGLCMVIPMFWVRVTS